MPLQNLASMEFWEYFLYGGWGVIGMKGVVWRTKKGLGGGGFGVGDLFLGLVSGGGLFWL